MKRLATLLLLPICAAAQPASPRIYVFENGMISGLSTELFNFQPDELAETDFVNMSYLIVHPRGTLQFDSGGVPDAAFDGNDGPVVEGVMSASRRLVPQLAAAGFTPDDIDYFALSHHHSDHTGNANLFAGDLYQYPEERTIGRVPTFEFDADQSRASRARVEAFVAEHDAALWIEHDIATHAALPKSPGFID